MASTQAAEWSLTKWSDAAQVLGEIGNEGEAAQPGEAPGAYCRRLIEMGSLADAATFLAHALPRYECIAWAGRALLDEGAAARGDPLMIAVLRWIDNPVDPNRRAAFQAAEDAAADTPARLLALAVYLSGGSLSEPDLPAVLPPSHVSAKLAAAALVKGAYASAAPAEALRRIVGRGVTLAEQGRFG
ncbi:MAG: hypothetical protein ABW203_08390 [Novosphingobium sp.]